MTAKPIVGSVSLVMWLAISTAPAHAEPAVTGPPPGEVRPDPDPAPAPEVDPDVTPGEAHARPETDSTSPRRRSTTGRFTVGAGFTTDDSFIAHARVGQDDLFGTGNRLWLDSTISARGHRFGLGFEDPHVLGTDLRLRAELVTERRVFPGFERHATGGALTLTQPLGEHVQAFVGYGLTDVTVATEPHASIARGAPPGPALRGGRLGMMRGGLAYSSLDAPWLPTRGTSFGAIVEIADRRLGSDLALSRTHTWLDHHVPLGSLTLHLGTTLTWVTSRDPRGVPLSERLHFDGSSAIRGLAPGALGPVDPLTGMSLGGTLAYTSRGELEMPLIPRLGISTVGFIDAGGIYGADSAGSSGWSTGVRLGVGLLWRSPIGPLRLDLAFPPDGGRPRFVFGLGASF